MSKSAQPKKETKIVPAAQAPLFCRADEKTDLGNYRRVGFYRTLGRLVGFIATKSSLEFFLSSGKSVAVQTYFIPYATDRQTRALATDFVRDIIKAAKK